MNRPDRTVTVGDKSGDQTRRVTVAGDAGETVDPRYLVDPVAVIVETVGVAEPALAAELVERVVREVLATRTLQRRVARALTDDPALLTSGRSGGPPRLAQLIQALRDAGGERLVPPRCGQCGRCVRLVGVRADGQRICTTCQSALNDRQEHCTGCDQIARVSVRDPAGRPWCRGCSQQQSHVDSLAAIVDQLHALDTGLDPARLREVVAAAAPKPFQQRAMRQELDADPQLLTRHPERGSPRIIALVEALLAAGAVNIAALVCPFCHRPARLQHLRENVRCCGPCYRAARREDCSRCGRPKTVITRTQTGQPLCSMCTGRDPVNREACPTCGRTDRLFLTAGGSIRQCASCNGLPVARCTDCGVDKPCRHLASGQPRCVTCLRRRRGTRPCARCGADRPVIGRDQHGQPLCSTCQAKREPCTRCHRVMRVVARLPEGPMCITCWHKDPAAARPCTACGTIAVPYHFGLCPECAWPRLARQVLTPPDGPIRPAAHAVFTVLAGQPAGGLPPGRARGLLEWARQPRPRAVLTELAQQPGPLGHDLLDRLPAGKTVDRLRATLITAGSLPARDEQLALLERWLTTTIATIDDPAERAALRQFTTWQHLRRLRRQSPTTPVTFAQAQAVRAQTSVCTRLLDWLHGRGRALGAATQHDIDDWLATKPSHHQAARTFLVWAVRHGHAHNIVIPVITPGRVRAVLPGANQRWAAARRLLHDHSLPLVDRLAGLLVLLFGQTPATIAALTAAHVHHAGDGIWLRLGTAPVHLPAPVADLLREHLDTRRTSTLLGPTTDHPWLFPGHAPTRPIAAHRLGTRLCELGVPPRQSRNTTLMDLANQLPAPVLARLLGLHIITATRWTHEAGNNRPAYAAAQAARASAAISRRHAE